MLDGFLAEGYSVLAKLPRGNKEPQISLKQGRGGTRRLLSSFVLFKNSFTLKSCSGDAQAIKRGLA
jgi:hypothetical protein